MKIIKYVAEMAQQLGANDPSLVVLVILLAFLFLVLIIFALRTTFNRGRESSRTVAILARVDQLENNLREFRAEVNKTLEQFRSLTGDVRAEMDKVRRGGGGGDEGGGSSTPSSGGGSGSGSRGGGRSAAPSVETPLRPMARGLEKSRSSFLGRLRQLFSSRNAVDLSSLDDIEEMLIGSDVGVGCASSLIDKVKSKVESEGEIGFGELRNLVKEEILSTLIKVPAGHRMYTGDLHAAPGTPLVVLVVGVNGVGKTTTTAKLAARWQRQGRSVVMVAADTFRAAAVEQLREWGRRLDIPVISGPDGSKPGTVVFDGMVAAKERGADVVIIDTAGRLHTKSNLMQELEGVRNSIRKHCPDAPHETVLVLDGVSGQNALLQAREFNAAVELTGIVVTKLDGTPKGGIVVAISQELKVPVYYVGVGEQADDLIPFSPEQFADGLLGEDAAAGLGGGSGSGGGTLHTPPDLRDMSATHPYVM